MPQAFTATRRFRLKILACMLKLDWMLKYGVIIKPDYFEQKDEHDIAECIIEFYKLYKYPPDVDDVVAVMGEEHRNLINSIFIGTDEWDLLFASDVAIRFAKEQSARIAVLQSLPDIERGELSTVVDRLQTAMKVGQDLQDTGLRLKEDADQWLVEVQTPKVPTGLIHLDIAMEGGLAAGELGVIIAPPNYGKSMALVNIGHGAAGPISRCNVIHFSFEMSRASVAKRYASRSVFRFPSRTGDTSDYKEEFERYARVMLPGSIRIVRMNGNVNDIRTRLNRIVDSGYKPDLIIVDYGDLVGAIRHRPDKYTELGDIFQSLRELGSEAEYNCPVWTATQSNRHSLGKEIITMGDLADSFQKAWVADAMVAICQTEDEEKDDTCRLFLAKLRDSKSRRMMRCKYYKEQQAIITTEFV